MPRSFGADGESPRRQGVYHRRRVLDAVRFRGLVGDLDPTAGTGGGWTNTSTIPTPPTDVGDNPPPNPVSQFGDDPIETLPNGNILAGYFNGPRETYVYSPSTHTWSRDRGEEASQRSQRRRDLGRLPDGSILSYDIIASSNDNKFEAQRYIPATGTWVDASTVNAANPPGILSDGPTATSGGVGA